MYVSSMSEGRLLQRLIWLKYYNVLKQESRSSLGLNAVENIDYIKKFFK